MTIQVIESEVKASANSIETAADNVHGVDLAGPLGKISSAMPSSVSSDYVKELKALWKKQQDQWVKAAHEHHKTTVADAAHIAKTDVMTAQGANQRQRIMDDRINSRLGGGQ